MSATLNPTLPSSFTPLPKAAKLLVYCLLVAGGCSSPVASPTLDQARELAAKGQYEEAETIAKAIPREDPRWIEAQVLLGDIATSYRDHLTAIPYYESVPHEATAHGLRAMRAVAELHYKAGLLSKAAEGFDELLMYYPRDARAQTKLAAIYDMSGMRARAEPFLFDILKTGRIELQDLVTLSEPDRVSNRASAIRQRAEQHPEDHYAHLGLARIEFAGQQFTEARRRVQTIVESHPDLPEAQALLGELLLDGELVELESWYSLLPESALNDPGIWYVRGLWARRLNQPSVAARCFWETVRLAPTHRRACYQLGLVLGPLDSKASAAYTERAAKLKEYSEVMEQILIQRAADAAQFDRMIAILREIGREWEAWGWAMLARDLHGPTPASDRLLKSLAHVPASGPPRFLSDRDLSALHDLSRYPDFDSLSEHKEATGFELTDAETHVPIHFDDDAESSGVDFRYFQSPDPKSKGVRIFESTGGGVGILDFDQDGWIDLFFTQGEEWPLGQNHPAPTAEHGDRLYRGNGSQFDDVSAQAGLGDDNGYGQGCSCGDFNNDGFPDLYVANIGQNQLLQNNGDGTFTDVTIQAGLQAEAWTTSCLILDLNLDGNPDLYDVNYLQGEQVFSVECRANRCSVRGYQGAPDQVLLSRGDGTFREVPDATPPSLGKGLGIVALYVEDEPRPSLFIANDQVPNFFLRPTSVEGRYVDDALLAGLAVNREGLATACMGVAAGDLNHDRRTDLFVTNYQGEAKVLYLQRDGGFFDDAIVGSGLMLPGIPYVGWGTQFLDADNNGDLDLVSTNGHVADFGEPGISYRMPTQFFRNQGQGHMNLVHPTEAGSLFDRLVFGRSLATCDWNRDGRIDFILSNINSPAIIATNHSEAAGHWLTVVLHATSTARDAVGSVVEVHQPDTIRWQQLLAGDGYQATNERHLHFGLGRKAEIDRIVVHWPSGRTATHEGIPVDRKIIVLENRENVFVDTPAR